MSPRRQALFADALASPSPHPRVCEMPGCLGAGDFRAPKARDRLNDYWWFCLEHVRAYNATWDYYKGMSAPDIERHIREDTTWQRPTWPLGGRRPEDIRVDDPFDLFGGKRADGQERRRAEVNPQERAAAVLDLTLPVTFAEVKKRYKQLVKRHHPDANGGDKAAEERLKSINEAYATLRASLAAG